jgi:predicted MFS family arabinose efflux permease
MAGSTFSMVGSRVTTIAYPMLVLYLTRSPFAAGWVAFAATAPSVFVYMPAGALVDRWNPRRAMLLCELGRGVAIAVVVVTLLLGRPSVLLLITVAIAEETLEVFSTLAERRYVWSLLEPGEASTALVPIEARTHLVVMAGRPLGGFLFGLTPILPFLADVLSFVGSVGAIVGIKNSRPVKPLDADLPRRPLRGDMMEGVRWLFQHRYARTAMILSAGATLVGQALIIIFLAAAHAEHFPSIEIGAALAASGAGGVLGTMAASWFTAPAWASLLQFQMLTWTIALAALALSGGRSMVWMGVVMAILGLTGALGNIEAGTYMLRNVEEDMLARVTSVGRLWSFGACAAGPVLGGLLAQRCGIDQAVFWLCGVTLAFAVFSLVTPAIRCREPATAAA